MDDYDACVRITSDGKIRLKKCLGENIYTIKAKVIAAGNANCKSVTKHVKFQIIVL